MKVPAFFIIVVFIGIWALPAMAKGPFAVLVVRDGDLPHPVEVNDPALLEFFSFSDFSTARLPEEPQDAMALLQNAYEVTRYARDDRTRELIAFDRLHFVIDEEPKPGLVFYDGIINGSSEYDQKWYRAEPQVGIVFQKSINQRLDPVGSFLEERRNWITILGALLGFTALARWALDRWVKKPA